LMSKERAVELLLSLLNAESEPQMSKEPVLEVVIPILEGMGLTVHRHENNGNPALFVTKGSPKLLLNGHLDTVIRGDGWTRGQGEVDGDIIYGRGALDMKGPCVSLLMAAEKLVHDGVDVAVAFTTDEEVGMMGAREIVAAHPQIAEIPLIIVCEPTGFRPVVEEKGIVQLRVRVKGKSAHASMPELGDNAVEGLMRRLQDLKASEHFSRDSGAPMTASIDRFNGGVLINVIPDCATAEIDIRFSADYDNSEVLGIVNELLGTADGKVEVEALHELPPVKTGIGMDLMRRIEEYLGKEHCAVAYGTEMVRFAELNRNIIILGPGVVEVAHQVDEWIDINEVVRAAEMFYDIGKMVP
jgi:succinyl-diaminopimelate desuccinylase